jgi:hypothetical protein
MDHMWMRVVSQLAARLTGPMQFRLVLQPAMAAFFAIRSGLADARAGKPPYFWCLVSDSAHCVDLIKDGWKSVGRVFILAGVPAIVFLRNARHALVRGKSIALSPQQFPQIYAILQRHCERLGIDPPPELYVSDMNMTKPARAYRSWKCDYVVLSSKFLQPDLQPMLPVFAFWLGREIGRLRLEHASWATEFLLAYVAKIPYLANPLRRVFTYSEDRYGAFLAPEGLPGLIGVASGRLMLPEVNAPDYLKQVRLYGGVWARLAGLTEAEPTISDRIKALFDANLLKY